jgi:hypothetical protein
MTFFHASVRVKDNRKIRVGDEEPEEHGPMFQESMKKF